MTDEEKQAQRVARDKAVCDYYTAGHKCSECASKFRISRQRVQQILHKAGVWKPYVKGNRTKFLGVMVTEEGKDALKAEADRRGTSVSAVASGLIEEGLLQK